MSQVKRHHKLVSEAASLRRLGLNEEEIITKLGRVNLDFDHAKDGDEIKKISKWAVDNVLPMKQADMHR